MRERGIALALVSIGDQIGDIPAGAGNLISITDQAKSIGALATGEKINENIDFLLLTTEVGIVR